MALGHEPTEEVSVQVSGCHKEDAQTLFAVLGGAYACDREQGREPEETPGPHHTVWSSAYEVGEPKRHPEPTVLQGTVTADVQGAPRAVSRVKDTLGEAFAVRVEGLTAGDQEQELRLRLETSS
ncbi:hypothetical protein [Streptomyces sp. ODS28]|uniref:hypothetical protein n=1 Tax=Streptomyces sp. ODS28 TaxID=3136688 RepID=UPI0031F179D1